MYELVWEYWVPNKNVIGVNEAAGYIIIKWYTFLELADSTVKNFENAISHLNDFFISLFSGLLPEFFFF
jgi:hypothetical protein